MRRVLPILLFVLVATLLCGCSTTPQSSEPAFTRRVQRTLSTWPHILTPIEAQRKIQAGAVAIDVRSAREFQLGHIPGAVHIPGGQWRDSDDRLFCTSDGHLDDAAYEALLTPHGIHPEMTVLVYGNRPGREDSTIPAMVLKQLGFTQSYLIDGFGYAEWKASGLPGTSGPPTPRPKVGWRPATTRPAVWTLEQVQNGLNSPHVRLVDTRSLAEWKRGHLPGAVHMDMELLVDKSNHVVDRDSADECMDRHGLSRDETLVLYCHTATRVSLTWLVLEELGFESVVVYDGSWAEYARSKNVSISKP